MCIPAQLRAHIMTRSDAHFTRRSRCLCGEMHFSLDGGSSNVAVDASKAAWSSAAKSWTPCMRAPSSATASPEAPASNSSRQKPTRLGQRGRTQSRLRSASSPICDKVYDPMRRAHHLGNQRLSGEIPRLSHVPGVEEQSARNRGCTPDGEELRAVDR